MNGRERKRDERKIEDRDRQKAEGETYGHKSRGREKERERERKREEERGGKERGLSTAFLLASSSLLTQSVQSFLSSTLIGNAETERGSEGARE